MKRVFASIFILPLFGVSDLSPPSMIAGTGIMPCARLLKVMPETVRSQPEMLAWFQGYVSALNQERVTHEGKTLRNATALTEEFKQSFFTAYCSTNGSATLVQAASALYEKLPVFEFK